MDTVTATQTDEQLLAEGLGHLGLTLKDVSRHVPQVWSAAGGLLTIRTARGRLEYRAGDYDRLTCAKGHTYPRWYRGCKQCYEVAKHSLDPDTSYAAREWLSELKISERKLRIASAREGGSPWPARYTT
ncbi:MAG: hypothetical protein Q7W02_02300 [Candidatus Rokubacteria bacterium]|nr:hypothetical protein [Candidatus Rokubacteria bacterium]